VFCPLLSSSKVAGVPEDSKFPLLGVWVSSSHFAQSGVATNPPWTWYYCISPNFFTLVILLQVDPAFSDKPETVYEGYKTKDTSIFAWSSILSVGHYRWLHGPIRRLPLNSKADYLARTIWRILDFLQLWIIIAT
jgi:hypothetical protein